MSAHIRSFPAAESYNRDLSNFELWERSLRRSVHRREITELARKHAARRKGAAIAVTASMAAGPTAAPFAAAASSGSTGTVSTAAVKRERSAIELPSNALVSFGDTGEAVAAVQRQVGVDDDGIFGPITRGAVSRYQQRMGLPVTGSVDAKTWAALFKANISFVGGGGKTVTTVSHTGGSAAETPGTPDDSEPASSVRTTTPKTTTKTNTTKTKRPATTAPNSTSTDAATNRAATTKPAATTPVSNPAPAPATSVGGGCGSGQLASPVAGTTTGVYGENRGSHAHAGKDIAAPTGTTVRAAQCGTVTKAGADSGGYGNLVCIQHEGGVATCYAHLSSIGTKVGAYVHVGDAIGKVGCTGSCTGPHLHFEVREHDKPVNPEPYLSGSKAVPASAKTKTATATNANFAAVETTAAAKPATAAAAAAPATAPAAAAPAAAPAIAPGTAATTAAAPATDPAAAAAAAPAAGTRGDGDGRAGRDGTGPRRRGPSSGARRDRSGARGPGRRGTRPGARRDGSGARGPGRRGPGPGARRDGSGA